MTLSVWGGEGPLKIKHLGNFTLFLCLPRWYPPPTRDLTAPAALAILQYR